MNLQELKRTLVEAQITYKEQEKKLNKLQKMDSDIDYLLFLDDVEKKRRGKYLLTVIGLLAISATLLYFQLFSLFKLFFIIPLDMIILKEEINGLIKKHSFKKNKGYKCSNELCNQSYVGLMIEKDNNMQIEMSIIVEMLSIKEELDNILSQILNKGVSKKQLDKDTKCVVIGSNNEFISFAEPIRVQELNKGKQKSKR